MTEKIDPFLGFQALRNELIDRQTASVWRALQDDGVDSILLKGPAIARWLYTSDAIRPYFDTDLLVPHERWDDAVATMTAMGYTPEPDAMGHPRMEGFTGYGFVLDEGHVDLHSTLDGVGVTPERTWELLAADTEDIFLWKETLPCLSVAARLVHLALHAAHHHEGVPLRDLELGLAAEPDEAWREAAALARELKADAFMATGLRLVGGGAAQAERIGLGDSGSVEASLHVADVPLAGGLHDLARTPGVRAKASVLRQELVPSPEFLRWWTSLARRPRGMPAAYVYRLGWMAFRLPRATITLARARSRRGT